MVGALLNRNSHGGTGRRAADGYDQRRLHRRPRATVAPNRNVSSVRARSGVFLLVEILGQTAGGKEDLYASQLVFKRLSRVRRLLSGRRRSHQRQCTLDGFE